MSNFSQGDRIVIKGEFKNHHGMVIADKTGNLNFQKHYEVKLDNGNVVQIAGNDLTHEHKVLS